MTAFPASSHVINYGSAWNRYRGFFSKTFTKRSAIREKKLQTFSAISGEKIAGTPADPQLYVYFRFFFNKCIDTGDINKTF